MLPPMFISSSLFSPVFCGSGTSNNDNVRSLLVFSSVVIVESIKYAYSFEVIHKFDY